MTELGRNTAGSHEGALRLAVVGASSARICGVRDYARVTAVAMAAQGADVTTLWWERDESWGPRRTMAEARSWLAAVDEVVERERPECILWHYSVFTWGHWGVPFVAPIVARSLARSQVPVLGVLHEFVFPFGEGGIRETAWAHAHRAALAPVWHACAGAIVTTEERAIWLRSRRWLARRPISFLPVCSNLPLATPHSRPDGGPSIGAFGFAADPSLVEEVAAALARVRDSGLEARLVLIGAPGATGPAADAWRRAAAGRSFDALSFTGVLEPPELARALASVDVVLYVDSAGPMSRKTTLAAALALRKPVVAVDGPRRWERLVEEQAVVLAQPRAVELAAALEALLRSEAARRRQGERGAAFYRRWMAADRLATETLALLAAVRGGSNPAAEPVGPRERQAVVT